MPALFLGSIGTLAETSDLQRQSFNAAFAEAGLSWIWSPEVYGAMLGQSGGRARIAGYAEHGGQAIDADALHARKSALFQEALARGVPPRPGVRETLTDVRARGWKTAVVTTTSPENVAQILTATGLDADAFDLIVDRSTVGQGKPDPECYHVALRLLDLSADAVLAVEDNPDGLRAAKSADLRCIAFPGAFHDPAAFAGADAVMTDTLHLPQSMAG